MSKISNTQRRRKNKKFDQFRRKLRESQKNVKNAPRIGKPLKSIKHKKLKSVDPFYHGERKDMLFAGKDQKPTSLEQEIPRKALEVLELMKQTEQVKKGRKRQKQKNKNKNKLKNSVICEENKHKQIRDVPQLEVEESKSNMFVQRPGESDKRFLHRLNEESKKAMLMAKLADKWDAEVVETEDGEYKLKKEKKPSEKKRRREAQKKEKKMLKKEEKLIDGYQDFKTFEDRVEFGEIVHAPPSLSALPRKANREEGGRKPGAKSLILKDILISNKVNNDNQKSSGSRKVGQTLKRKLMSPAQQVILDSERERVIDVYRKIRDAKQKKTN
ncbi:coiled-coil domain-containing protein 137 [Patella vulgata]|uniref:coiled-coil domain-containing protein 137 n=1 Tax=Patella vulgata TaxID=6465 RepID=UPI0021809552|nr:coiled-coil domain-containing protein 137 [Patella vulgata]